MEIQKLHQEEVIKSTGSGYLWEDLTEGSQFEKKEEEGQARASCSGTGAGTWQEMLEEEVSKEQGLMTLGPGI